MSNKQLVKLLALPCAAMSLLAACHRTDIAKPFTPADNTDILGVMMKYAALKNVKSAGTFIFESIVMNNDPSIKNTVEEGGVFYDKASQREMGGGTVTIGNQQLQPNSYGSYGFDKVLPQQGLYGTNVAFTLTPPASHNIASSRQGVSRPSGVTASGLTTNGTVTATVSSPLPITVTNIAPQAPPVNIVANSSFPITWNADPNNTQGVCILAQYLPNLYANRSLRTANPGVIINSELVTDNGSTSLPTNFFSNFPLGGQIILFVGRGNYTTIASADSTSYYEVGGYTATAVYLAILSAQTGNFTPDVPAGWASSSSSVSANAAGLATCSITVTCPPNLPANINLSPSNPNPASFVIGNISGCLPNSAQTFTSGGKGAATNAYTVTISPSGVVSVTIAREANALSAGTVISLTGTYSEL